MRLGSLRVAAAQIDCTPPLESIEGRAVRMIERAAKLDAAVVCLPEHWVPGGIRDRDKFLGLFEKAAAEFSINIITGGEFVNDGSSVVVESFLIGPRGAIGSQRKVHLFGRERRKATPGGEYQVFTAGKARIGVAICHDLVYPEVARIFALKGADVVFSPAKIARVGIEPWHLYVKARALENRLPIVTPNVLELPRFTGGSMIVGFSDAGGGVIHPHTLARAGAAPRLLVADLDLKHAGTLRRQRLRARRTDTYSPLLTG